MQRRKKDDDTYEATTWQIKFQLDNADERGTYKLRLALATAHASELQVWIELPHSKKKKNNSPHPNAKRERPSSLVIIYI